MKKGIAIIIVIALVILAGVLLFFYKDKISVQNLPLPVKNAPQTQQAALSIIDDKDFSGSTKGGSYSIGPVEFKIQPPDDVNMSSYFEVYRSGVKVFTSQPDDMIIGLLSFMFGDNKYVVMKSYSGGAHCCDTDYLFRVNSQNQVKLIKTFDMGNASITKDSLLVKDNKLYLALIDGRFSYFHIDYAHSYFFTQYYRLDGDTIALANGDFATDITKTAQDCKAKIATDSTTLDGPGDYWLNDVLCYIINYSLVGKRGAALKDYDGFFNKFFPSGKGTDSFDEPINREKLKQEIIDTLNL